MEGVGAELMAKLNEDGDSVGLPDGRLLRFRVEPDMDFEVNDDEFYGKTGFGGRNDFSSDVRPEGFDGNAEKLWGAHDSFWWQPPEDGPERGTKEFEDMKFSVTQLHEYGFKLLTLELCDGKDAYGHPIVRSFTTLGGVDWTSGDYSDYLGDMIAELEEPAAYVPEAPKGAVHPLLF